jgi:hypothetical protein
MRRFFATVIIAGVVAAVPASTAAYAANPNGHTGPPDQSCQDQLNSGGTTPGNSASSPGSPFNEPGFGSPNGGIGGQNYSESSQYDVACFQVSTH